MNQRPRPIKAPQKHESGDLRFGTRNYAALGSALVSILIGFLLLSRGSITAAPILLVLGYCVLIPYGLAAGRKRTSEGE